MPCEISPRAQAILDEIDRNGEDRASPPAWGAPAPPEARKHETMAPSSTASEPLAASRRRAPHDLRRLLDDIVAQTEVARLQLLALTAAVENIAGRLGSPSQDSVALPREPSGIPAPPAKRDPALPARAHAQDVDAPPGTHPAAALPELRLVTIIVATLVVAIAFGLLLAVSLKYAVALLAAAIVVPLMFQSVPALVGVWIGLVYLGGFGGLESLPNRFMLLTLAAAALVAGRRSLRRETLMGGGRLVLALIAAFVFWQLLSLVWAPDVAFAKTLPKEYAYIVAAVCIVLATMRSRRDVRWLALAFVCGAVASVLVGVAQGGLTAAGAGSGVDPEDSRFAAGSGDPNYLAAMLVPAVMLAGGLSVQAATRMRLFLLGSVLIMAVGLAATQSRGGLIAAVIAFAAAFVLMRDQRRLVMGAAAAAASGLLTFFLVYPRAWERIVGVKDSGSGSGRTDIWGVAWDVITQHPFIGVGLNQFPVVSPTFVRQPGSLGGATSLIVDEHIVVHNVFLQLWAETGIVGLSLFLALVAASLGMGLRAAQQFDVLGDAAMAALSRAVVVALLSVLTASFFLSNILARQIWVLLVFGPVMATLARSELRSRFEATHRAHD